MLQNTEKYEINNDENPEINLEASQLNDIEILDLEKEIRRLQELNDSLKEREDKFLRTIASYENDRKRHKREIEESKDYATVNLFRDLIGIMDNLKRALGHKTDGLNEVAANILAGVDLTKQEFASVFQKYGLESIEPSPGEKFDYNFHHALSQIVTDEYNPDTIINTMQEGYKIKDRLLRPAIVTVSKKS